MGLVGCCGGGCVELVCELTLKLFHQPYSHHLPSGTPSDEYMHIQTNPLHHPTTPNHIYPYHLPQPHKIYQPPHHTRHILFFSPQPQQPQLPHRPTNSNCQSYTHACQVVREASTNDPSKLYTRSSRRVNNWLRRWELQYNNIPLFRHLVHLSPLWGTIIYAPALWNSFASNLRQISTVQSLNINLKTHFIEVFQR